MKQKKIKSKNCIIIHLFTYKRQSQEDKNPFEILVKVGRDEIIARKFNLELLYELESVESNIKISLPKIKYRLRE